MSGRTVDKLRKLVREIYKEDRDNRILAPLLLAIDDLEYQRELFQEYIEDTRRLNWLEQHGKVMLIKIPDDPEHPVEVTLQFKENFPEEITEGECPRSIIDKAMKHHTREP